MIKNEIITIINKIAQEKMCCTTALEKELLSEILLNLRLLLKIKEQGLYNGIYKDLKNKNTGSF